MGGRLFLVPAPLKGDEKWLFVSFCIPDTPDWRGLVVGHIETLTYGRAYDEQTGYIKQAQEVGREIFTSMSMCLLEELLKQQRMLVAAIVGEEVDLTDPDQVSPESVDYTTKGLIPTLRKLFVDQRIGPDWTIAQAVTEGLVANKIDFPLPFSGKGLADITEDNLDNIFNILSQVSRELRVADDFIGTKGLAEVLETTLRRDTVFDPEGTPNITSVLDKAFNIGGTDTPTVGLIKKVVKGIAQLLGMSDAVTGLLEDKVEETKQISTVEVLLLLLKAIEKQSCKDSQLNFQLNNHHHCDQVNGTNGNGTNGDSNNFTIQLTDEGATISETPALPENL